MTAFAVPPPPRARPAARVWLPLALSLTLHALFGLAVVLIPSGEGAHAGGPLPADAVALDEGNGRIILDEPSPSGKAPRRIEQPAPPHDTEESEPAFPATVSDPPVVAPSAQSSTDPGLKITGDLPTPLGGHNAGPGGAAGRATGLLRPPATARKVVYLIDRSLSMGLSGALPVAKRELLAGLDALPADSRFAVILYNREVESAGLLPATEANRAEAARLVEEVRAEGGTEHLAALRRAVALGADVIFLVTDADEMTAEKVRNVALLNRGRAVIHTIELNDDGDQPDETPLKLLARLTGGTHRVVAVNHREGAQPRHGPAPQPGGGPQVYQGSRSGPR
jgi:hypothetical protein